MKFEKLAVKIPHKTGGLTLVHDYVNGTINFRANGFVYVYWGEDQGVDVYSGNYCFEIEPKEVKK